MKKKYLTRKIAKGKEKVISAIIRVLINQGTHILKCYYIKIYNNDKNLIFNFFNESFLLN